MDLAAQAAGIGALADPTRRALYEYVVAQDEPVGREAAATALHLAPHTAKFHLDKLVDEGLLDTEFRRLSGRTGPGAGRPSKLYVRGEREFAVSLPERRYDLVGHILATAFDRARHGMDLDTALAEAAHEEGREVAAQVAGPNDGPNDGPADGSDLNRVATVLERQGYEPRVESDNIVLANCPFDTLAAEHTALVCGLNQSFVQGVADELAAPVTACLEPEQDRCCVRARRTPTQP